MNYACNAYIPCSISRAFYILQYAKIFNTGESLVIYILKYFYVVK